MLVGTGEAGSAVRGLFPRRVSGTDGRGMADKYLYLYKRREQGLDGVVALQG
jgi:hypothetical protein